MSAPSRSPSRVTYWIIVPESGTDMAVRALRRSWLSSIAPEHLHFCVQERAFLSESHFSMLRN